MYSGFKYDFAPFTKSPGTNIISISLVSSKYFSSKPKASLPYLLVVLLPKCKSDNCKIFLFFSSFDIFPIISLKLAIIIHILLNLSNYLTFLM